MMKTIYIFIILLFFCILAKANTIYTVTNSDGTIQTFNSSDGYSLVKDIECEPQVIERWVDSPNNHRFTFNLGTGHYTSTDNNFIFGATMNREWNHLILGTTVLSNETVLINLGKEF